MVLTELRITSRITLGVILWLLSLIGCVSSINSKTVLVIYSTHGKELLTEFESLFEQKNPQVDVRWMDMGSQDVLDRLRSEKENPQADVVVGCSLCAF